MQILKEVINSERNRPTDKNTINIVLNGEQLKTSSPPLKLRTRQGCLLSSVLFNIIPEILFGTKDRKEEEGGGEEGERGGEKEREEEVV